MKPQGNFIQVPDANPLGPDGIPPLPPLSRQCTTTTSRSQLAEIILVDHKQVGPTVNPIILKDFCRWTQPVLLQYHQSTCICSFHHWTPLQHEFPKKRGGKLKTLRPSTVFVQTIQLFKANYNKWHFNRLMKDVQQSIIQRYLEKVTLWVIPQTSVISASLKSPNLHVPSCCLQIEVVRTHSVVVN